MVLNKINSYLTGKSNKFPSDFNKIINVVNFDSDNKESQINLLWEAYSLGVSAHKDQLRKSGDPFITHPLEVAKILTSIK